MQDKTKIRRQLRALRQRLLSPGLWLWLTPLLLLIPNIGLTVTETYAPLAKTANLVLPAGVYLLLMTLTRRTGRVMLWLTPLMVLCAFQIVLLFLYGESIIAIDMFMNVMTTNVGEATELLANLKGAIVVVCLLYVPVIGMGVYFVRAHRFAGEAELRQTRRAGLWLTGFGILVFVAALLWSDGFSPRREMFPYNVCANLVSSVERKREALHYGESSATFSYRAESTHADTLPEVYVFVIGETSRADNWQLMGYGRPTNPRLSQQRGVTAYSRTLSEVNTTHKSVPMLLSWLTADTFGSGVGRTRSIFEAFNSAGYATAFISNQRRNHSYIDFYGREAQHVEFISDSAGPQRDANLLGPLDTFLAKAGRRKAFVVLHTYGSHFEYNKRYGREMAVFRPDGKSAADVANRAELLNAYDNTIVYTDSVLSAGIDRLRASRRVAAMIYVSDHGEDIFDDARGRFLHASPVPTYWQLHVPMIVWTSDEFGRAYPRKAAAIAAHRDADVSSTASVFHTLMDMAGLRSPYWRAGLSLASDTYRAPARRYLNDYNESVPLSASGLRASDFSAMRRAGIRYD